MAIPECMQLGGGGGGGGGGEKRFWQGKVNAPPPPPLNEALQEGCTYICGFVVEVAVVENQPEVFDALFGRAVNVVL